MNMIEKGFVDACLQCGVSDLRQIATLRKVAAMGLKKNAAMDPQTRDALIGALVGAGVGGGGAYALSPKDVALRNALMGAAGGGAVGGGVGAYIGRGQQEQAIRDAFYNQDFVTPEDLEWREAGSEGIPRLYQQTALNQLRQGKLTLPQPVAPPGTA